VIWPILVNLQVQILQDIQILKICYMESQTIDRKNKLDEGLTFKISRFREQIKRTQPHTHAGYYEWIFLEKGEGFHCIESEKFIVKAPEAYLLQPGQLHFWEFTSLPKGFVILFNHNRFDALKDAELISLCNRVAFQRRIGLSGETYPSALLEEMFREHQANTGLSGIILNGLIMALAGRLLGFSSGIHEKSDVPHSTLDKFILLLDQECTRLHKVHEFAERLNITPQNLNNICQKQGGLAASVMITNRILLEAKRFILHTDLTIGEIAHDLSFRDASHFGKFFKQATGLTPFQFRTSYFGNDQTTVS